MAVLTPVEYALFTTYTQTDAIYKATDGNYFVSLKAVQAYSNVLGLGSYTQIDRPENLADPQNSIALTSIWFNDRTAWVWQGDIDIYSQKTLPAPSEDNRLYLYRIASSTDLVQETLTWGLSGSIQVYRGDYIQSTGATYEKIFDYQHVEANAALAEQYAQQAEEALSQIAALGYQGKYNPVTNTPALSGTPNTALANGAWYEISAPGTLAFATDYPTGKSVNKGDVLRKSGSTWKLTDGIYPRSRVARVLPFSGNIVINTVTRKISTTGRVLVAENLSYSDTDDIAIDHVQDSTDWDSTNISGLHFIIQNTVSKLFHVVRYDKIGDYDQNIHTTIGLLEKNASNEIKVVCDYPILVDGEESQNTKKYTKDLLAQYQKGDIFSFNGVLNFDTVNRTIEVSGDNIYVIRNGNYTAIAPYSSPLAWDSSDVKVINYVIFDSSTTKIRVVAFDRIQNYSLQSCVILGVIGTGNQTFSNKTFECTVNGRYRVNGVVYNGGFPTSFQMGVLMPFGDYLNIDTVNKKISLSGNSFVLLNGKYYTVNNMTNKSWSSSDINGINYVFYNIKNSEIEVLRFDNSEFNNTRQDDRIFLGFIGTDTSGKLQVNIAGSYKVNGAIVSLYDTVTSLSSLSTAFNSLLSEFQSYKRAEIMHFKGDLIIDTVALTIKTDDQVFVVLNKDFKNVSAIQSSTAWDSDGVNGLHYILFNLSTLLFAVVKYNRTTSYSSANWVLVGTIGTDVYNKLNVNVFGDGWVDSVRYPLQPSTIKRFDVDGFGAIKYQDFVTDYSLLLGYSQSLFLGWESHYALTTLNYPDTYMVGDRIWINHGNNGVSAFNQLVGTFDGTVGESPLLSTTNSFKLLFDRQNKRGGQTKFVAINTGEGGQTIEQLSKECTNNVTTATNLYATTFLTALNRAKSTAQALGKTISCPVLIFAQGEYNYNGFTVGTGLTTGSNATNDKDTYKALLLTLKNNMQADVMSILGQTEKPLFFMYQTSGNYINRDDMSISQAQLEFATENDDVILMNPHYALPDYSGGHLSANGYRWFGEMCAKALHNAFHNNQKISGIVAKQFVITSNKTIEIDFSVPKLPLVLDTKTTPLQTSYGFRVKNNGGVINIGKVSVLENKVTLYLSQPLVAGSVEITYAGNGRNGSGNLRDSDNWKGQYTYYDDSSNYPPTYNPLDENSQPLYGKRYPCWNWAYSFYKSLTF